MKLKKQLSSIMILLALVLSAILVSSFVVTSKINEINGDWHNTNQNLMAKNNALFDLSRHFGYGGFIHHFKNLVLRQTEEYSQQAEQSMVNTLDSLSVYKSLATTEVDAILIRQFEDTVNLYNNKLVLIQNELAGAAVNIHKLDEEVKVDDSQAIAALEILSLKIEENHLKSINLFNQNFQSINRTNLIQLSIIIPLILIAGAMLTFYALKVTRAYSELETIFNVSPDALIVLDMSGKIIRANPNARDIFGYSKAEFESLTIEDLVPKEFRQNHSSTRVEFQQKSNKREAGSPHAEVKAVNNSGKVFPVEITLASYGEHDSKKTIANVKDLSRYKNLETLSTTDHLTGIANRLKLDSLLQEEIHRAERLEHALSFIILDIDHFKSVNDTYGHQEGDLILQQFAHLVDSRIRKIDTCGRWGGEEFCIICPGTTGSEAFRLAEDLRLQIAATQFGKLNKLTASFGVASHRHGEDNNQDFIQRADIALYQSKQYGRNQVTLAS